MATAMMGDPKEHEFMTRFSENSDGHAVTESVVAVRGGVAACDTLPGAKAARDPNAVTLWKRVSCTCRVGRLRDPVLPHDALPRRANGSAATGTAATRVLSPSSSWLLSADKFQ